MLSDVHKRAATRQLRAEIESGRINKSLFSHEEITQIDAGKAKLGKYTWHHHQDCGRMQLIPEDVHAKTGHVGGNDL